MTQLERHVDNWFTTYSPGDRMQFNRQFSAWFIQINSNICPSTAETIELSKSRAMEKAWRGSRSGKWAHRVRRRCKSGTCGRGQVKEKFSPFQWEQWVQNRKQVVLVDMNCVMNTVLYILFFTFSFFQSPAFFNKCLNSLKNFSMMEELRSFFAYLK